MFSDVTINKSTSGLGRQLPNNDHISSLTFYSDATLPSGFSSGSRIKIVRSVADAEALGITNTHLGETKSTGTYAVSAAGAAGDVFKMYAATIQGSILLCSFTAAAGDVSTTTTMATAIKNAINARTYIHGFTSTSSTSTVTMIATPGQGVFLNSGTVYSAVITGTIAGTFTQNVVVGVASDIDIMYYHIKRFFARQPKGKLYVQIEASSDVGTFSKITTLQNYAQGEILQGGTYYKNTAHTSAHLTTMQSILTALETNKKPMAGMIMQGDYQAVTDWTTEPNLRTLINPQVQACIAQDGAGEGYVLWKATGKTIGAVGELLGTYALAKVNENPGWVGKFPLVDTEFDTIALANGDAYLSLSDGVLDGLNSYGYVFLRKLVGKSGSYWNGSFTAVATTSDYCKFNNNRTITKAIKNTRAILLDALNSPIKVNADGTLSDDVIGYFTGLCKQAIDPMMRDDEISNYKIIIDPSQNVLSTSTLAVTIKIVPVGDAEYITVNIGFTLSLK